MASRVFAIRDNIWPFQSPPVQLFVQVLSFSATDMGKRVYRQYDFKDVSRIYGT